MAHGQIRIPVIKCCFVLNDDVKHVLIFTLLRTIFLSSAGVFIPALVYSRFGFNVMILYMFAGYSLFYPLAILAVRYTIKRKSLEFAQFLSIMFAMIQIFLLSLCHDEKYLVLPAFFCSLSAAFYWIPKHIIFGLYSERRKVSEQYAFVSLVSSIVSIILPILTGFLVAFVGFEETFFVISITIAIASLLMVKVMKQRAIKRVSLSGKPKPEFRTFFAIEGARCAFMAVLPVMIYVFTKDAIVFGGLTSMMTLFAMITAMAISKRVDEKHDYTMGALSAMITANACTVFFLEYGPLAATVYMIVSGLVGPLTDVPLYGFLYKIIRKYGVGLVFTRATTLSLTRGLFFLLFLIIDTKTMLLIGTAIMYIYGFVYYYLSFREESAEIKQKNY